MSRRNTFEQRLRYFSIVSNRFCTCTKLILTYKLLQGVFGMKAPISYVLRHVVPQEEVEVSVCEFISAT